METEELIQMIQQVDDKGISWDTVKEKIKVSRDLLILYSRSGPVPVKILTNLKELLEAGE